MTYYHEIFIFAVLEFRAMVYIRLWNWAQFCLFDRCDCCVLQRFSQSNLLLRSSDTRDV